MKQLQSKPNQNPSGNGDDSLSETIAQKIKNDTYRALEVYLCAGLIYLVLNFAIARAMAALEYYLSPHLRAIPASRQSPNPAIVL